MTIPAKARPIVIARTESTRMGALGSLRTYDKAKVEKHIQQEFEVYFEFCSALLGTYLHTSLEIYKVRFVKAVYKHFYNTGKLLPGITFFKQKYMRFL